MGSTDSSNMSETSEQSSQHPCIGAISHLDLFMVLPLVPAAWQLGWATGCWKMLDAGKSIYLPISCLTSYREWSFLRVATFFAAWSFLALEMKKNMKVNIQMVCKVIFRAAKGRKTYRAPLNFCRVWYSCWITQLANVITAAGPCLFLRPMVSVYHVVSSRDKRKKKKPNSFALCRSLEDFPLYRIVPYC